MSSLYLQVFHAIAFLYEFHNIETKDFPLFSKNSGFTDDSIRGSYGRGATCQDTMPHAIMAFLVGTDIEDGIRNAISIGGDFNISISLTKYYIEHHHQDEADGKTDGA